MVKPRINKKVLIGKLILILVIGIVLGVSCIFSSNIEKALGLGNKSAGYVNGDVVFEDDLAVHYIDVGQGDSTLICLPDDTVMLIDAGTKDAGKHIVDYIYNLGIKTIDYFILTHSDADHSGGAKQVFDAFEIKNIYRPFQISIDKETGKPTEYEYLGFYYTEVYPTTSNVVETLTYERFITAAYTETYKDENGVVQNAKVFVNNDGLTILSSKLEIDFTFEFFAPLIRTGAVAMDVSKTNTYGYPTKYYGKNTAKSYNDNSPVMLLEYSGKSFMFTGDANSNVEKEVIASLSDAEEQRFKDVDVFQAGHHGSETSNCQELLSLICPTYVVVSVGEGNSYKHPTEEFLSRVNQLPHRVNDYLLRTDKIGDIEFGFTMDGTLCYKARTLGEGIVVYWWQIAIGIFIVLSIVILSVKVTKNKVATAKRAVKQTKKVVSKTK